MTPGMFSMGGTWGAEIPRGSIFFLNSHVAYQIDGGDEQNRMQVKFSPSGLWKGFSDEIPCVQFSFCFLRLQFYFVNYFIVSCELPYYNSFDNRMLLKN